VRKGWALIGETPIVYKNGSKESISIGGAYSSTKEFHFYKMDNEYIREPQHLISCSRKASNISK